MASNLKKAIICKISAVRGLTTCAATPKGAPAGGYSDYVVNTTTLPNKIIVSSAENSSLISRISIIFRAGSRNEDSDNLGVTQVLRVAAGLSTKNLSQFAIVRNLQETAAKLTCSVDREIVSYTLECTRAAVENSLLYLNEVATQQCFRPWEVSDNLPRLKLELATRLSQIHAVDLVHNAAYRRGLGNSIYIAKHNLNKISTETLQHYVEQNFFANRCAVVGLGIDHADLVCFAKCVDIAPGGCGKDIQSELRQGEIRKETGGSNTYIALCGEGGALQNAKEALSFAILQRVLGVGTYIKYANEKKSPFAKLQEKYCDSNSVTAFNVSYSDSGLFGAVIMSPSKNAGSLLESVVKVLKSGRVTDEDFKRGKSQAITALQFDLENGINGIEEMGKQAVLVGSVASPSEIVQALDSITEKDVNDAAQKLSGAKFAMASVGNLSCVPYIDSLIKS